MLVALLLAEIQPWLGGQMVWRLALQEWLLQQA
jgi:hypothetical protein